MISELDMVVLTRDLPADSLKAGDIGTIVLVHGNGVGFEVEFTNLAGDTLAVLTVPADAVRAVSDNEIAHVRQVA